MNNDKKTSLQEAQASFEEIKKFARQSVEKEFEKEINEKVNSLLKEALSIDVDDEGNVTIEKDDKVVELEKTETGETEVEVEDKSAHEKEEDEETFEVDTEEDNEPIEIDETMITQEEQLPEVPQTGTEQPAAPAVEPVDTDVPSVDAPEMKPEGPEPVEQIAQNLANEILKLVKASNETDASAGAEVVIDDEAGAEAPAEPPAEPAPAAPVAEEEIFEIAMDEIEGNMEEKAVYETGMGEDEEYIEVDPTNSKDVEAMLAAFGDISREKKDWKKDVPELDLPKLEEQELEETKMQGQSNTVQKSQAVSAGPEIAVQNRGRQNGKDNTPHTRLEESVNKLKAHYESKVDELTQENKRLSESVKESANLINSYKESFVDLRKQFDEMQTFNAKLAYANKLFASGGLSTDEKAKIAEQFDKTESVDEAKKLYDSIIKENKVSVNVSNVQKIKSPATNAVKPKNEPLYENAEMKRMKELAGLGKNED